MKKISNGFDSKVLQLTIIWRGVLIDDIAILFQEESIGSSQWFFGLLSFAALVSSFVSLTVTSMYYNDEKLRSDRPIKFFVGLGLTMFSILYRVFISSILFAVSPFWVLGISLGVYVITVTVMKATGKKDNFVKSFSFHKSKLKRFKIMLFRPFLGVSAIRLYFTSLPWWVYKKSRPKLFLCVQSWDGDYQSKGSSFWSRKSEN